MMLVLSGGVSRQTSESISIWSSLISWELRSLTMYLSKDVIVLQLR